MKERILFVVEDPYPLSPQAPALDLAQALHARGMDVGVIQLERRADECQENRQLESVEFYERWKLTRRWGSICRQLVRAIRDFQPTVIHAWGEQAERWCRIASSWTGGSVVIAETRPQPASESGDPVTSDLPVTQSLLITSDTRPRQTDVWKRALGIPDHAFLVGAIAPFLPCYRLKDVLWAADLVTCIRDDVYWLLLGDGPQRWRLQRFASQLEVGDHVRFLGWHADAESILASLDVFVQPSVAQEDYLPLGTALKHGVPLVTTSQSWHAHFVDHGSTGYVVERGARNEFARCVHRLANQPQIMEAMRVASRKKFATDFDREAAVQQWFSYYQGVSEAAQLPKRVWRRA